MTPAEICDFNGREVTVRELTLGQVITLLRSADEAAPISVDLLLDLPGAGAVMMAATGLSEKELEAATPSDAATLLAEVTRLNPHYAAAANRLKEEMEKLRAMLPETLSGLAAGSSSAAAMEFGIGHSAG